MVRFYKNGTGRVGINTETGSKYYLGDWSEPEFPDSVDLKITEICQRGCPFCHESSGPTGRSASLSEIMELLKGFPRMTPIEFAIGGGDPLEHPELAEIIDWMVISQGWIVNLTIHYSEVPRFRDLGLSGISGLGISLGSSYVHRPIETPKGVKQVVYHTIAGITPTQGILKLLEEGQRVLVMGYKNLGRGLRADIPSLGDLERALKGYIHRGDRKGTLVFDNLGIDQLNIKGTIPQDDWEELWMGPEFSHSMYIDAPRHRFSPSSTTREIIGTGDPIEYYRKNHAKATSIY